jgi:sulfur carrier protein
MRILINRQPYDLAEGCSLEAALTGAGFKPPFAVALNLQFVPKTRYGLTPLKPGDEVEVISPITGG